jgi:hypothetical protein
MKKAFDIDLDIYPEVALQQAISDFSEVWGITLSWKKIEVVAQDDNEIEEIFNEFMNYTIGLINA